MSVNMLSRSSLTVARAAARRNMSTASPKMHKAGGNWEAMKSKRKIDHDDLHTVFHPPFNAGPVWGIVGGVWVIGVGSMLYGYMHQQWKQGFWK